MLSRRNYYLWGYSGQLNAGDDVFARVVSWGLRRFEGGDRLFMNSDLNGVVSRCCGIETAVSSSHYIPGLTRLRRAYFRHHSNALVLAGGSLLSTRALTRGLLDDRHWTLHGRQRIGIGLSVGPFESVRHEQEVAELLGSMEYVALRDDYSYSWARSQKIKGRIIQAFDLAVLLPEAVDFKTPVPSASNGRVIGVSLLPFQSQGAPEKEQLDLSMAREIGATTARIASAHRARIVYLSMSTNPHSDDRKMGAAFAIGAGSTNVDFFEHNGDPVRTFERIQGCSHVVSMRLHGGIMAFSAGVSFLQLEYHPKCSDFAKTIGLANHHRLDLAQFTPAAFAAKFERLLGKSGVQSAVGLRETQVRALRNFKETTR